MEKVNMGKTFSEDVFVPNLGGLNLKRFPKASHKNLGSCCGLVFIMFRLICVILFCRDLKNFNSYFNKTLSQSVSICLHMAVAIAFTFIVASTLLYESSGNVSNVLSDLLIKISNICV